MFLSGHNKSSEPNSTTATPTPFPKPLSDLLSLNHPQPNSQSPPPLSHPQLNSANPLRNLVTKAVHGRATLSGNNPLLSTIVSGNPSSTSSSSSSSSVIGGFPSVASNVASAEPSFSLPVGDGLLNDHLFPVHRVGTPPTTNIPRLLVDRQLSSSTSPAVKRTPPSSTLISPSTASVHSDQGPRSSRSASLSSNLPTLGNPPLVSPSASAFSYSNPFHLLETKHSTSAASVSTPPLPPSRNPSFVLASGTDGDTVAVYNNASDTFPSPSVTTPPNVIKSTKVLSPSSPIARSIAASPAPSTAVTSSQSSRKKSRDVGKSLVDTTLSPPSTVPNKIKGKDKTKSKLKESKPTVVEPKKILPSPKHNEGSHQPPKTVSREPTSSVLAAISSALPSTSSHIVDITAAQDTIIHFASPPSISAHDLHPNQAFTNVYRIPSPKHSPGAMVPKHRDSSLFRPLSAVCKSISQLSLTLSPHLVPDVYLSNGKPLLAQSPDGTLVAFVDRKITQGNSVYPESHTWKVVVADLSTGSVFTHPLVLNNDDGRPDMNSIITIALSGHHVIVACQSGSIYVLFLDQDTLSEHSIIQVAIPHNMFLTHMMMIPSSATLVGIVQDPQGTLPGYLVHVLFTGPPNRKITSKLHVALDDPEVSFSLADITRDGADMIVDVVPCAADLYYITVTRGGTVCIWTGPAPVQLFSLLPALESLNKITHGGENLIDNDVPFNQAVIGLCNPVLTDDKFIFLVATRGATVAIITVSRFTTELRATAKVLSAIQLPLDSVVNSIMSSISRLDALGSSSSCVVNVWIPFQRQDVTAPTKMVSLIAMISLNPDIGFNPSNIAMFLATETNERVIAVSMRGTALVVATNKPMGIQYAKASNLVKLAEWVGASVAFPPIVRPTLSKTLAVPLIETNFRDSITIPHELVPMSEQNSDIATALTERPSKIDGQTLRTIQETMDVGLTQIMTQLSVQQESVVSALAAISARQRSPSPVQRGPDAKELANQVAQALHMQIVNTVQDRIGQIVRETATSVITESLVPAYERATKEMFQQVANTFQTGVQDIINQIRSEVNNGRIPATNGPVSETADLDKDNQGIPEREDDDDEEEEDEDEEEEEEDDDDDDEEVVVEGNEEDNVKTQDDVDNEEEQEELMDLPASEAKVRALLEHGRWEEGFRMVMSGDNALNLTWELVAGYQPPTELSHVMTQPVIVGLLVTIAHELHTFASDDEIMNVRVPWLVACAQAVDTSDADMARNAADFLLRTLQEIEQTENVLVHNMQFRPHRSAHLSSFRLLSRVLRGALPKGTLP